MKTSRMKVSRKPCVTDGVCLSMAFMMACTHSQFHGALLRVVAVDFVDLFVGDARRLANFAHDLFLEHEFVFSSKPVPTSSPVPIRS